MRPLRRLLASLLIAGSAVVPSGALAGDNQPPPPPERVIDMIFDLLYPDDGEPPPGIYGVMTIVCGGEC